MDSCANCHSILHSNLSTTQSSHCFLFDRKPEISFDFSFISISNFAFSILFHFYWFAICCCCWRYLVCLLFLWLFLSTFYCDLLANLSQNGCAAVCTNIQYTQSSIERKSNATSTYDITNTVVLGVLVGPLTCWIESERTNKFHMKWEEERERKMEEGDRWKKETC